MRSHSNELSTRVELQQSHYMSCCNQWCRRHVRSSAAILRQIVSILAIWASVSVTYTSLGREVHTAASELRYISYAPRVTMVRFYPPQLHGRVSAVLSTCAAELDPVGTLKIPRPSSAIGTHGLAPGQASLENCCSRIDETVL